MIESYGRDPQGNVRKMVFCLVLLTIEVCMQPSWFYARLVLAKQFQQFRQLLMIVCSVLNLDLTLINMCYIEETWQILTIHVPSTPTHVQLLPEAILF